MGTISIFLSREIKIILFTISVKQLTTYAIHWKAINVSNDVSNAKVEAILPGNVTFTGKMVPDDARLTFNERSSSIVWEIGNIKSGSGISKNPPEVAFQVKAKPSPEQIGDSVVLIRGGKFTAKDNFTGEDLLFDFGEKNNFLTEDESLKDRGYKVVP